MKSWRVYGIDDMRLVDEPVPAVRPGWLLAKVKSFQPSITEIQLFHGVSQRGLTELKEKINTVGSFRQGHEVCAVVEDIVDDCEIKKGDRIAYFHEGGHVAGSHYPGCFAECYLLPISAATRMDPEIPDIEGPALQPFSSCVRLVKEVKIESGKTVAVFGQGVMGLNVTQLCALARADKIIGVDVREQCLRVSRELGANVTINASQQDPVKAILEVTNGKGADVVVDCASGSPEVGLSGGKSLFNGIDAIRRSGTLVQVAFLHEKVNIDLNILRAKRIKYIFPDECYREDMMEGTRLLAEGKIRFKPYITHVLQGIDKLPEAFEITANKARYGAINPAVVVVSS
jgi:threonine dehydrogenase-like Zn-dependent dehydrogenase